MKTTHRTLVALMFAFGILVGSIATGTALAVQSHMIAARANLNSALRQLTAAQPDKAGHRVKAISLVNQAIVEVNAGIVAGR